MSWKKQTTLYLVLIVLVVATVLFVFSGTILSSIGEFLVVDEPPVRSDAVVVLNTGLEYYSRLIQAADLYRQGFANKVVINGNRKNDVLRELERQGFQACCLWYEESVRILELLGVPRKDVIAISVEEAYDTISEAREVGKALIVAGISSILVTTSKFHTRRARYIWKSLWSNKFNILTVAARSDMFSPNGWWKSGRQIRWVLAEYGAWLYYYWKEFS